MLIRDKYYNSSHMVLKSNLSTNENVGQPHLPRETIFFKWEYSLLAFFRTWHLKARMWKHAFYWHGHFGGVRLRIGRQLARLRKKTREFVSSFSTKRRDSDNIHEFANSYKFLRSFAKYQVSSHRCLERSSIYRSNLQKK